MAIVKQQHGTGAFYAQAGSMIGKARRAEEAKVAAAREAEQAARIQQQILSQQHQRELREFDAQLSLEREKRQRLWALQAEDRARQWQIEKMEMVSRMDFEQNEKERLRKKAVFNSGIETIDNNEGLTDTQKETAKFLLATKYTDIEEAGQYLGLKPQTQKTGLFNLGGEETPPPSTVPGVPTADNPLGLNITEGVSTPLSTLPQSVLALEQRNEFEVISPDGKQETIRADEWPEYKARGYVLAQIKRQREKAETRRRTEETVSGILAGGYGGV